MSNHPVIYTDIMLLTLYKL